MFWYSLTHYQPFTCGNKYLVKRKGDHVETAILDSRGEYFWEDMDGNILDDVTHFAFIEPLALDQGV